VKRLPLSLAGFLVFVAVLCGIFVSSFFQIPIFFLWALIVLGAIFLTLGITRQEFLITGFIVIAFSLGCLRMLVVSQPDDTFVRVAGERQDFLGEVVDPPDVRDTNTQLVIETADFGSARRVLVIMRRFPEFLRGESVYVSGVVQGLPKDNPGYRASLVRRGISGIALFPKLEAVSPQPFSLLRLLDSAKVRFESALASTLPEPDASFVIGILIGARGSIPQAIRDAFSKTGTSHIIALSGFNITIIALAISWALGFFRLSQKVRVAAATMGILLFVVVVGGGASVVRAALMGVLALVALQRGRVYEMTNALLFAAVLMALSNPYVLRFDVSFQLSFLATLGIIVVPPRLASYFQWAPERFQIREILTATIAAEIFVFPLILWNFGTVSAIGPLANLLVLPFIPLAMLLGFITGILAMASPFLALPIAWALHLVVTYQLGIIQLLAGFFLSSFSLPKAATFIFALPAIYFTVAALRARFHPPAAKFYV